MCVSSNVLVVVLPFFAIGVETHPVWKDEVFQNYPEIRQLRTVQWTQRAIVREAIGKLHTINLSKSFMSEEDVRVEQNLRDLIRNTNTYLEAKEAAFHIFRILSKLLDRVMEFQLESETNTFEDMMMERQVDFKPLKNQIDLILEEFLYAIIDQRITLDMPEFEPSFDYEFFGKTTGSLTTLKQTDVSFVVLTDNLLTLIYDELKLKDCISKYEEMYYSNGRRYCI